MCAGALHCPRYGLATCWINFHMWQKPGWESADHEKKWEMRMRCQSACPQKQADCASARSCSRGSGVQSEAWSPPGTRARRCFGGLSPFASRPPEKFQRPDIASAPTSVEAPRADGIHARWPRHVSSETLDAPKWDVNTTPHTITDGAAIALD